MSRGALEILEEDVKALIRARGIDPVREGDVALRPVVAEAIAAYEDRASASCLPLVRSRSEATRALVEAVAGFGPLQPLMDDETVEEIWINAPGKVFCAKAGTRVLTNVILTEQQIRDLVERMLRASGRRLDVSSPFVDATLPDGSRLHVAIGGVTRRHWALNVRKFIARAHGLADLVRLGALTRPAADYLAAAVRAGRNVVVSGGTQTGKTTLLNCLASAIAPSERLITCEEVFEIRTNLPDVVSMQTRPPNVEGNGEVSLRRLILESLRMRPDRLIVGEVRGAEALDLLIALNSGLPAMTSLHANSASDALVKLATLPLLAAENISESFVVPTIARCVDIVVHLAWEDGNRLVAEIVALTGRVEGRQIEMVPMFKRVSGALERTGNPSPSHKERAGRSRPESARR